ncbi:hypothetical protein ACJ73_01200 [Blastomyces percursus]|uniref:Uncharacterized protein n=1 Tax=Blastomyces percursus TaxID=1658174 RepID=A0A1J9R4Y0_9EURO|nr:hypothetical protein ACJ73_01200 [Blastomyces percursus]
MIGFLLKDQNVTPIPDSENREAISHASEDGRAAIPELLLRRSAANINLVSQESRKTPLIYASPNRCKKWPHLAVVEQLLRHEQTDPDFAPAKYGRTPLYLTASNDHDFVVFTLLLNRVDVNINYDALAVAIKNEHQDVVCSLLCYTSIDINNRSPLALAAAGGHEAIVQLLLRQPGVDVNGEGQFTPPNAESENPSLDAHVRSPHVSASFTPLSAAMEKGHRAITSLLLSQPGIDDLHSPLARAACHGHDEIVRRLLCHEGSDVDIDGTVVIEGF